VEGLPALESVPLVDLAQPGAGRDGLTDRSGQRSQLPGDRSDDGEVFLSLFNDVQVCLHAVQGFFEGLNLGLPKLQLTLLAFDGQLLLFDQILKLVLGQFILVPGDQAVLLELCVALVDPALLLQLILDVGELLVELELELLHRQPRVPEVVALLEKLGLPEHYVHKEVGVGQLQDLVSLLDHRAGLQGDLVHPAPSRASR
jgi:hypothetical protein